MKRVAIVGMGFGGLSAAKRLADQEGLELLLIDQNNYHLFQPLLYQVATATIEQEEVAYPVRAITRHWKNVRFILARVTDVDLKGRQLVTDDGPIEYDYLVLSPGVATRWPGIAGLREFAFDLKTLSDAVTLRNHILTLFERADREDDPEERARLLTFVVAGAGPVGVEFCGALAEMVQQVMHKDYPQIGAGDVHVILVEATNTILPLIPKQLSGYAIQRLQSLGVEVRLNAKMTACDDRSVTLETGKVIPCATLLWAAGIQAPPLIETLKAKGGQGGRVAVEPDLSLPGHPEVFVIGDAAYFEQDGQPLGAVAQVAMQMGDFAGRVILLRERNAPARAFTYNDLGVMAVIGRGAAASRIFNLKLTGLPAWLVWAGIHIFMLIDFRNRVLVLINWAYDYLFFDRKIRLITWTRKERDTTA